MTAADRHAAAAVEAYANAARYAVEGDVARATLWLGAAEAAVRLAGRWQDRADHAAEVTP